MRAGHTRRTLLIGLGGCLAVVAASADRAPRLLLNTTASAPEGLYWVSPGRYALGDFVAVDPPPALASWMASRGYLPANIPLLKVVVAVNGQLVCGTEDGFFVDGRRLARAKARDRWGRALPIYRGCETVSVDDVVIVNTGAPDSLDSRYFGPIPARGVIGRARPFWTWEVHR